jgi:peptidyl-prolyl cis-trans isomerase D
MVPVDYAKNVEEPAEDELKVFFEETKDDYAAPEYRSISYLAFDAKNVESEIDTSDNALQAAYDDNTEDYSKGEVRTLEQIFANEAKVIVEVHAALNGGKSFADAAKELAEQDESALAYGDTERNDLAGIIDEAGIDELFALEVGGYAKPVKSLLGWHIFKVVAIKAPAIAPFEDVKAKIKKSILAEQAGDLLYQFSGRVEDELASGSTFEEAAKNLDLKLKKVNDISSEGEQVVSELGLRLPKFGDFLKTAFAMDESGTSQLMASDDSLKYYMLRVDGVTPARMRVLEEARGRVVVAWKKQKQQLLQVEKANEIAEGLLKLEPEARLASLKSQAKNMGLKLKPIKAVYRGSFNEAFLPRLLVEEIFTQTGVGASGKAYARNDGVMVLGVVSEVVPLNEEDPQFGLKATKTAMRAEVSQDVMDQLITNLHGRYKVEYRK